MAMQQMLLGLGAAQEPFWISELWDNHANDQMEFVLGVGEHGGNVFIGGGMKDQSYTGRRFFVVSFDSEDGSINWHKVYNDSANQSYGRSMRLTSDGDPTLHGMYSKFMKCDGSDGDLTWGRDTVGGSYAYNGGFYPKFHAISSGDGHGFFGTFDGNPWFTSVNPAGSHTNCHRKIASFSGHKPQARGLAVSSNKWVLLMQNTPTASTGGNRNSTLIKRISETGSVVYYERELYYPSSTSGNNWGFEPQSIATDTDHNTYVGGEAMFGNDRPDYFFISKWNESGTHQWVIKYGDGSSGGVDATNKCYDIECDGDDNVYAIGQSFGGNNNGAVPGGHPAWVLAKFNSSGVLQWGRYIKLTTSNDYWNDRILLDRINISSDDKAVLLCGIRHGSNVTGIKGITMKLDTKGPKTGTWGDYTIGDMPTSGSYAWTASTVTGYTEHEEDDGTWTNTSRTNNSNNFGENSISWASNTVHDVS